MTNDNFRNNDLTTNAGTGRNYNESEIDRLFNATVYGSGDDKIGSVGQVYLNDASGQPEWVTVKTGLFGASETFVPLKNAQIDGDRIHVPYTKDFVKDAPNIDPDKHIDENEQSALYRYYEEQGAQGERFANNTRNETVAGGVAGDRHYDDTTDRRNVADRNANDGEMVAHEERLNVGKEQTEAGRVKLRKRVVTENQQVTVPVQREELVVDRQPINERVDGAKIGDARGETEEIVLHEERPVVSKETIATEKVNVGKQVVTENQVVQDQVRKEQIEVEGQGVQGRDGFANDGTADRKAGIDLNKDGIDDRDNVKNAINDRKDGNR